MKSKVVIFFFSVVIYTLCGLFIFLQNINNSILPSNRFYNNAKYYTNRIIPQGFGFFTLDPNIKITNTYVYDTINNRFEKLDYFPMMNTKTFFGINSLSRLYETEIQNVLRHTRIKIRMENKEGNSISKAVNELGNRLESNDVKHCKTVLLSGIYIITVQNVLPYEWRKSLKQDEMSGFFYKIAVNKNKKLS